LAHSSAGDTLHGRTPLDGAGEILHRYTSADIVGDKLHDYSVTARGSVTHNHAWALGGGGLLGFVLQIPVQVLQIPAHVLQILDYRFTRYNIVLLSNFGTSFTNSGTSFYKFVFFEAKNTKNTIISSGHIFGKSIN